MLLAALNQPIVATALPRITEDLGGLAHYSWVFSAYMLASTVTVPVHVRNTGGTVGVGVMGALMAAGLPRDAASASPDQLAHAIHPVVVLGVPLMALAFVLVLLIPEKPLRRSVREGEPAPTPA